MNVNADNDIILSDTGTSLGILWHLKKKSESHVSSLKNVYSTENNGGLIKQQSKQPQKILSTPVS